MSLFQCKSSIVSYRIETYVEVHVWHPYQSTTARESRWQERLQDKTTDQQIIRKILILTLYSSASRCQNSLDLVMWWLSVLSTHFLQTTKTTLSRFTSRNETGDRQALVGSLQFTYLDVLH